MAQIIGKNIIGAIGPAIFTKWRSKQVLKSRVPKGWTKLSLGTRNIATVFGLASSFGSYLRDRIRPIHFIQDGTAVNRMNTAMAEIFRTYRDKTTGDYHFQPESFKPLEGFELNIASPLKQNLQTLPEISLQTGKLKIRIPDFDVKKALKFPDQADSCTIIVSVQMASLKTGDECYMNEEMTKAFSVSINDKSFAAEEWSYDIPEGCYCVTSIALHYHREYSHIQVYFNNKTFCPAMICDFSINPGEFKDKPRKWTNSYISFADGKFPPITKKPRSKKPKGESETEKVSSKNKKEKAKKEKAAKGKKAKKKPRSKAEIWAGTSGLKVVKKEKLKQKQQEVDAMQTENAAKQQPSEVKQQQRDIQLQQYDAQQQKINELEAKLATLERQISLLNLPNVQFEPMNVALQAGIQTNLLDVNITIHPEIPPRTSMLPSVPLIQHTLPRSSGHRNRGKPAA